MAGIRPSALPPAGTVTNSAAIIVDDGANVQKATPQQIVDAIRPIASEAEARAGVDNAKMMTPLRAAQSIDERKIGVKLPNGNVGFGTATPAAEIEVADVSGDNDVRIQMRANVTNYSQVGCSSTSTFIDSPGARPIAFYTNSVARIQVDAAGHLLPLADNAYSLGSGGNRYSVVYAATGAINTSDGREKTAVRPLNEAELAAARIISGQIGIYQWLAMIDEKGADDARLHCGVIAQEVIAALEAEGLDPFRYGFVCYDEWEDRFEEVFATREVEIEINDELHKVQQTYNTGESRLTIPAGNRYGIRPDELLYFLLAAQEQRLAALEAA